MFADPPKLDVRTAVVLFNGGRLLLLHRAPWKKILPNQWTGIGGKVEADEMDDLVASARRELFEETDLRPEEVGTLRLRRSLTLYRPNLGIVLLLYLTAPAFTNRVPACNEGTLAWVRPEDLPSLAVTQNTTPVLPLLIEDERSDDRTVHCGIATYAPDGTFLGVTFPRGVGAG